MQLVSLHHAGAIGANHAGSGPAALERSGAAPDAARPGGAAPDTVTTPTAAVAPMARPRGLSNWNPARQAQAAGAQRSLDFLERGAAQLQGLKSDLSARLAGRQLPEGQLDARLRQFGDTWQQRPAGVLDALADGKDGAPALAPAGWRISDADGLRQSLQQVVGGLERFQQARQQAQRTLAAAAVGAETSPPSDAASAMARLAGNFATAASAPGYASLLAVHSALAGVSRERVTGLLRLRP